MTHIEFTFADFFAGLGGFRLAFEENGFNCVFTNEIDEKAIKIYKHNFENEVCSKSIKDLEIDEIPNFDIFVGGFPCQSFSIAGNRKGFDDVRGELFFDIVRILKEKKPKAFLLENVKNLKTHDKGKTYSVIKNELLRIGYNFKCKIMNTCDYGNLPQNRERIYLVGFLNRDKAIEFKFPTRLKLTNSVSDILEPDIPDKYYYTEKSKIFPLLQESIKQSIIENETVYQYRRTHVRENKSNLCPTLTSNMGSGGHNVPIIRDSKGIRKLTPRECFNLQGFPQNYKLIGSDSALYCQIGNSISVPVVNRIVKNIKLVL